MTGTGRGRHSSDDRPGGVPPFYWVSTTGGPNSYDGSGHDPGGRYGAAPSGEARYDDDRYDSGGYDRAPYDHGTYDRASYDHGTYDRASYDPDSYDHAPYDTPRYDTPRYDVSGYSGARYDTSGFEAVRDVPAWGTAPGWGTPSGHAEPATGRRRRVSGLLDRADETGPVVEPDRWRYTGPDDDRAVPGPTWGPEHPSQPVPPPLPPLPSGAWDRLQARADGPGDDGATEAHPLTPGVQRRPAPPSTPSTPEPPAETGEHLVDPHDWEDRTGGLDVIGANVDEDTDRGPWWRRRRRAADSVPPADGYEDDDLHDDDLHDDDLHDDGDLHDEVLAAHGDDDPGLSDDDIPVRPYDPRQARARKRKRPIALVVSLLVLGGLVAGIVLGGQKLLGVLNPSSRDFAGQGTGEVEIRVQDGDTLSDIARTLVDAGVIASVAPFVDAAEAHPEATSIQPGVYGMHEQMSGKAALDLLLEPGARLVSRITVREGLTVKATFAQLAEATGTPVAELQKAATDPAALGVPAWAKGNLEGMLFPATYDFEPDTPAADMLRAMVTRANQALDELHIPAARRQQVLTEASIVQAEAASSEDMAKVATVLNNRIAHGMPLQLDTTVNYANGKSGITTSPQDRKNPSPYNTYLHGGLPPGPISNPGEDALRAVLNPAHGDWLFFVVVNPDTGETRFSRTGEEHDQNVQLFRKWLREHPNG